MRAKILHIMPRLQQVLEDGLLVVIPRVVGADGDFHNVTHFVSRRRWTARAARRQIRNVGLEMITNDHFVIGEL